MTEPTDAELAVLRSEFGITSNGRGIKEYTQVRDFARAVLAKWGNPATVGVEPVARLEIGKTKGGVSLTHIAEPAAFQLPEGMYALYTTPQPTQAQAGAVPLTDERLDAAVEAWFGSDNNYDFRERMRAAIDSSHGIKGGQHG